MERGSHGSLLPTQPSGKCRPTLNPSSNCPQSIGAFYFYRQTLSSTAVADDLVITLHQNWLLNVHWTKMIMEIPEVNEFTSKAPRSFATAPFLGAHSSLLSCAICDMCRLLQFAPMLFCVCKCNSVFYRAGERVVQINYADLSSIGVDESFSMEGPGLHLGPGVVTQCVYETQFVYKTQYLHIPNHRNRLFICPVS